MMAIWRTRIELGVLVCSLGAVVGCPNTDAAVFVELSIENPNAAVQTSVLTTTVDGSFDLKMHLGPRATDSSLVELGELSVTSHDLTTILIAPLGVISDPVGPWEVGIDSDVTVSFTFPASENEVPVSTVDGLCDSSGIVLSGAFDGSLEDALKSVSSVPFPVSGCP